jgi:hypothetical protein
MTDAILDRSDVILHFLGECQGRTLQPGDPLA